MTSRILYSLIFISVLSWLFSPLYGQRFSVLKTNGGIEIAENGSKVLFYQSATKANNNKYARANYIHPLYSLKGDMLTEDFPEDHPHHRGIFWAWHQIILNGKQIADSWSCENIAWEVVDTDVRRKKNEIALVNEVLWKSVLDEGTPETIIRENSTIIVHAATGQYRLIDFEIGLSAAAGDVKIGGSDDPKGYGGFSLRFRLPEDIVFMSRGEKITAQELAVQAGPWMDMSGSFGKKDARGGITVICHPDNPGHPEPWILRSTKSMQNPAFPGRTPVALTKEGLRFRYRLVVHDHELNTESIEKMFRDYSH
ncbi:MAG: PmoA family protein [Chryseosolibacter sp.]